MLETAVAVIIEALKGAGLNARERYVLEELDTKGSLVCVGAKSAKNLSSGFTEYLGIKSDAELGDRELYGFRTELSLSLDVYVPEPEGERGCQAVFAKISDALFSLPSGMKRRELRCFEAAPDSETRMFKQSIELCCSAYFVSSVWEESGEFSDFVLRGVMRDGN